MSLIFSTIHKQDTPSQITELLILSGTKINGYGMCTTETRVPLMTMNCKHPKLYIHKHTHIYTLHSSMKCKQEAI